MSDNSSPRQSTPGNSSPTFRQLAPNMETLGGALGYQFSYCQLSPSPVKSTYLLTYYVTWLDYKMVTFMCSRERYNRSLQAEVSVS